VTGPGLKVTDPELSSAPANSRAGDLGGRLDCREMLAKKARASVCQPRIFSMRNGLPVTVEERERGAQNLAAALRPTSRQSSTSRHPFTQTTLVQSVHDLDEILLRRHYRVDWLVGLPESRQSRRRPCGIRCPRSLPHGRLT